jgi:hypothetical protein
VREGRRAQMAVRAFLRFGVLLALFVAVLLIGAGLGA